jgi:1-acylglycerone phosphate reductase
MTPSRRTVLITGCSDGGMGAALAIAFHKAGLKVYATARNPTKMADLARRGVETMQLDVQSEASIQAVVKTLSSSTGSLDILVNNAGAQFVMPLIDVDIAEAKRIYDLNVWSHIAVTQAFIKLLLAAPAGLLVNHTSVAAGITIPMQGVYNSSKAAMASLTDTLRMELAPFGIKVVQLRTGIVQTNLISNYVNNAPGAQTPRLPDASIYAPAREPVEKAMRQEGFEGQGMPAAKWADETVQELLRKNPTAIIWKGDSSLLARVVSVLPSALTDGTMRGLAGMDKIEKLINHEKMRK